MSLSISSAEPTKLYRYADVATHIDHELLSEANYVGSALYQFEATCQEPGFAMRVSYLADSLRGYANQAGQIDDWYEILAKVLSELIGAAYWRWCGDGFVVCFGIGQTQLKTSGKTFT
jgi:hypothetical protein